jgi:hypothetical protein
MGKSYVFVKKENIDNLFNTEFYKSPHKIFNTKYYDIETFIYRLINNISFSFFIDLNLVSTINELNRYFYVLNIEESLIFDTIIPIKYIWNIEKYCCNNNKITKIDDLEIDELNLKLHKHRKLLDNNKYEYQEKNNYINVSKNDINNFIENNNFSINDFSILEYDIFDYKFRKLLNFLKYHIEDNIKYYYFLNVDYCFNDKQVNQKNINKISKFYIDNRLIIETNDQIISDFNEKLKFNSISK